MNEENIFLAGLSPTKIFIDEVLLGTVKDMPLLKIPEDKHSFLECRNGYFSFVSKPDFGILKHLDKILMAKHYRIPRKTKKEISKEMNNENPIYSKMMHGIHRRLRRKDKRRNKL